MSRILHIVLTVVLICICFPASAIAKETRVLFVGNSFTFVGNMPKILAEMCKTKRVPVKIHMCAPGGFTLDAHSYEAATLKALDQKWDFIILQDQSQTPAYMPESTMRGGKALAKKIKNTGAKTILFVTWGYAKEDGTMDIEMQELLTKTYCALAKEIGATIAPVGPAWQNALAKYPKMELYAPNDPNCHPSRTGAYFDACIFYNVIFGKPATGLPSKGPSYNVNPAIARQLQQVADETVKNFVQPNQTPATPAKGTKKK